MSATIAVIDYGAGNLRSITRALEKVCVESGAAARPVITADPAVVAAAGAVVLPGVGAAGPTMARLAACGLAEPLRAAAAERPFLGVCLGLQLLFTHHDEGDVAGLGVFPGTVRRFPGGLKVPHMGWNRVYSTGHPMFVGIAADAFFYYVHSYYADADDPDLVVGVTEYGRPFCGALARGRLWATQFHPEKSGACGLRLLRNFVGGLEPACA
jgi:glutamine amidotransferase